MKIKTLRIENFRVYSDPVEISFEDLTVLIGKNDSGKSTVLEALDIFFNDGKNTKIDSSDVNVNLRRNGNDEISISVLFEDLPEEIIIDSQSKTTLEKEYLLNENKEFEVIKRYKNGSKAKVWIKACHPTNSSCSDLLLKKNAELKKIVKENAIVSTNTASNPIIRQEIWQHFQSDLQLNNVEIDASKEDAKVLWEKISSYLPIFTLFQSDRSNSDSDSEIQDPLKEAVRIIMSDKEIQKSLQEISDKVTEKLNDVASRTLDKMKEIDSSLANTLNPVIPTSDKLKWSDVFKSVSITGDDEIPINKRGSGVRRLILLSFFRAEAERLSSESSTNGLIYAVEEPETSQHSNNQKLLIDAFKDLSCQEGTQVLLTTHSAYIVKQLDFNNLRVIKESKVLHLEPGYLHYPSLNEVNYIAFNETSEEYHNELYGVLQAIAIGECESNSKEKGFDEWLELKGISRKTPYIKLDNMGNSKTPYNVTLPTLIRNVIHHPENPNNRYTKDQLICSINSLRETYKNCTT